MPYPMVGMPTAESFAKRAISEFGCTQGNYPVNGQPTDYLERKVNGIPHRCPLPDNKGEVLTPFKLDHLCRRLKIDASNFGLNLPSILKP